MTDYPYIFSWANNPVRAKYKNKQCRILAAGKKSTVLVEFKDGFQMATSCRALRRKIALDYYYRKKGGK